MSDSLYQQWLDNHGAGAAWNEHYRQKFLDQNIPLTFKQEMAKPTDPDEGMAECYIRYAVAWPSKLKPIIGEKG